MNNKAFTLVEILIVVIILGILAAIVIPQFTQASEDARESALASDLQMMRSQLELYKVQHLEYYPHVDPSDGSFETAATWATRLLTETDNMGDSTTAGTGVGPYMQKIPSNPFVPSTTTVMVTFSDTTTCPGNNNSHWWVNEDTGQIYPNDSRGDSDNLHKTW